MNEPSETQKTRQGRDRLIFALDLPDRMSALRYVDMLMPHVGMFKVGLELFTAEGPGLVREIAGRGAEVFLDLKCHDIPATVRGAAASAHALGAGLLSVHACDGPELIQAAVDGAKGRPKILAITVLTSIPSEAMPRLGVSVSLEELVLLRSRAAAEAGAHGIVCSPREVSLLRKALGSKILLVTPGIRPASVAVKDDDQARTMTPREAILAGADKVVVGRPIRDAADPAAAAAAMAFELETT